MKTILILIALASTFSLTSCKNAADSTTDATVQEAAPETPAAGGQAFAFTEASTIGFVGSKVTGSHEGGFKKFTGHFTVNGGELAGGEVAIDMASTWSDAEKLTEHLKAPDFFDVENHPETTFKVTSLASQEDGSQHLSGNLTLHGVTKNITFPVEVALADDTLLLIAEFDINRKDFGIAYAGRKDDLIRDEVIIKLNVEAKPKA